jgi:NAD(P)H-flavin reductase/hemoglobin-like flavoprotein
LDVRRLKESFARVAMHGDEVPLFFYSDLFLRHPEARDLFPISMAAQRDRLVHALAKIVSDVDNLDDLVVYLQALGRDHRKFGTAAEHYPAVGTSLLATLAHFNGPAWTADLAADWKAAYDLVAKVMIEAADEDARTRPACWEATVVAHELRRFDIAIFRVATAEPLDYLPGQSVSIESAQRPRIWRLYSMANAPREDLTMDFHVRMLDGGVVSMALARGLAVGARLRLGPPAGTFTYGPGPGGPRRDVLLIAGSTGLAPIKAITEQIADLADPPQVQLFFGARTTDGLYDLADLEKMAAGFEWLTVIPAVSDDRDFAGEQGRLPDVVARSGRWQEHDAYVCGPGPMVAATAARLAEIGVPPGQIHIEDFGWSEP